MSPDAAPQSSPATTSNPSEAGWDSSRPNDEPAPTSELNATSTTLTDEDGSSESDIECPTPANEDISPPEPVEVYIDAVEENPDMLATPSALVVNDRSFDPQFCFDDSNVTVRIETRQFRVHEFKLNEFENLKSLIKAGHKDPEGQKSIEVTGNADDFRNMLTIIYASAYGPQSFDTATLKSALRVSAMHDNPQLRTFCIRKLQKLDLSPIERFALSRDCNIRSWMSKALDDLCWKEEPITVEEAEILGTKKFVEVAARREDVKFGRGSRMALTGKPQNPAPVVVAAAKQIPPVPTLWDAPTPTVASTSIVSPTLSEISSLPSPPAVPTPRKEQHAPTSSASATAPTPVASPNPTTASTLTTTPTSFAPLALSCTLLNLPLNKTVLIKPAGSDVGPKRSTIPPVSVSSGNFSFQTKNSNAATASNTTTLPFAFGK